MLHLSAGDWVAVAALGLTILGNLWGFLDRRKTDVAKDAAREATISNALGRHSDHFARLFRAMETANRQFHQHELECADFRGRTVTALEAIVASNEKTGRSVEQMQSQIRFVAAGAHDRTTEI